MIALIGCAEWPSLGPDDKHLLDALSDAGLPWTTVSWDDPSLDWPSYDAAIVRATWDYFRRFEEFDAWIAARRADGSRVWNPPDVLAWNIRKDYLRALSGDGVPVVETEWVPAGGDVRAAASSRGWERAVAKPVVSAGGWLTEVIGDATSPPSVDMMVQPFLPQIEDEGEWSFVFFGGAFSHAFLKRPAAGNFLVQERHGGTVHPMEAPADLLASASRVLAHVPFGDSLLYARVDGVRDGSSLLLIELEVFEPVLYFGASPGSAARLVDALLARM